MNNQSIEPYNQTKSQSQFAKEEAYLRAKKKIRKNSRFLLAFSHIYYCKYILNLINWFEF